MINDLSFKDVRKFVRSNHPELLEDVDAFLSLLILFSPLYAKVAYSTVESGLGLLSDLLGVKSVISNVGKRIYKKVTGKDEEDILARLARMEVAYILICYTAFFEALENQYQELSKEISFKPSEKFNLTLEAIGDLEGARERGNQDDKIGSMEECMRSGHIDARIHLPHPVDSFEIQFEQLLPLYEQLTKEFFRFVKNLAIWDTADDEKHAHIRDAIHRLPELANSYFKAQYFELATTYNEFFIWTNFYEHEKLLVSAQNLTEQTRKVVDLTIIGQESIDVGFSRLFNEFESLPMQIEAHRVSRVLDSLKRKYNSAIEERIIKETVAFDEDRPHLVYPKKNDIFIPQAFKALRYNGQELELETTWAEVSIHNDLGSFLLRYLSSPYSADTPLIILGHPGSGKSLLTLMIAARVGAIDFTPIRIELRGVNAESSIREQIIDQLIRDTGDDVTWAELLRHCPKLPVILLDGYDEILQASGKVFANYLSRVREFQNDEFSVHEKPIRAIVTSRITLIDKATLPQGCTVIQLQEFDVTRRQKWSNIWNETNHQYFENKNIEPFKLPRSEKVIELAKQPLLLSMLALFDSENNELRKETQLDQSVLYDRLLRRFIKRERVKDPNFREKAEDERHEEIDLEMQRLGVAAIGMFNLRRLNIKIDQLNDDLAFFNYERELVASSTGGRSLSQGELLLGSFFFVYESQATSKQDDQDLKAFEFLHNTFGEFLTADFMLSRIVEEASSLWSMSQNRRLQRDREQKLNNLSLFSNDWFACFMYTPLYSRPVVLEMMREWLGYRLKTEGLDQNDFENQLDAIVKSHIEQLLKGNTIPKLMLESSTSPFEDLPVLGHIAIYTLNLILLRVVLASDEYVFDEEQISAFEDGTRAWDRLTFLWRSWFSLESLEGMTAVIEYTKREADKIHLKARDIFTTASSRHRLDSILNVSLTLGDSIGACMAGLLSHDNHRNSSLDLKTIEALSKAEQLNFNLILSKKELRNSQYSTLDPQNFERQFRDAEDIFERNWQENLDQAVDLAQEFKQAADIYWGDTPSYPVILRRIFHEIHIRHKRTYEDLPLALLTEISLYPMPYREFVEMSRYILSEYLEDKHYQQWPLKTLLHILRHARQNNYERLDIFITQIHEATSSIDCKAIPPALLHELILIAHKIDDFERLKLYYEFLRSSLPTKPHRPARFFVTRELLFQGLILSIMFEDQEFIVQIAKRELHWIIFQASWEQQRELLKLAKASDSRVFMQSLFNSYCNPRLDSFPKKQQLKIYFERWPTEFNIAMLEFAKNIDNEEFLRLFWDEYVLNNELDISSMPLRYMKTIRWLARKMNGESILSQLDRFIT